MFAVCGKLFKISNLCKLHRSFSKIDNVVVSEEVRAALKDNIPVVALESTIVTHGMPYPENVKCALEVAAVVRNQGAIPASVAIMNGQIKVGLSDDEMSQLGDVKSSRPIKTSRRDLAYVISNKLNGGTTVSGTLLIIDKIGIPVFATGGIGGVHRGGEATFDVSADLTELGKCSAAVISCGVKSILDVPKTLEYLETQGVFVASFGSGTTDFPSFYCRKSGCHVPYAVQTAQEAAKIIHCSRYLNIQSGMLFAVPVPEKFALDEKIINDVIEEALKDAKANGIEGKETTPFLLARIGEITAGKSLETNIALIKNNAKTAADIAVELAKLRGSSLGSYRIEDEARPVVIGGSNLDCSIKLRHSEIKMDGRIHFGKSIVSAGGVARNICDALAKLDCRPGFISALGDDAHGTILKNFIPDLERVKILEGHSTGYCVVVLDSNGECRFLAGDMSIHSQITSEMIHENEDVIRRAPLIIFDANLTTEAIEAVLKLAQRHNVPAFFEPTDVEISSKPFETDYWKAIKFITPNINELKHIATHLQITQERNDDEFEEVVNIASKLTNYIDNIIVTLGADGVIIARRGEATDRLMFPESDKLGVRHYTANKVKQVVNVSGAGDNLASGIIVGMLAGLSEEECVSVGLAAAQTALHSWAPVADCLFGKNHESWRTRAPYRTLI